MNTFCSFVPNFTEFCTTFLNISPNFLTATVSLRLQPALRSKLDHFPVQAGLRGEECCVVPADSLSGLSEGASCLGTSHWPVPWPAYRVNPIPQRRYTSRKASPQMLCTHAPSLRKRRTRPGRRTWGTPYSQRAPETGRPRAPRQRRPSPASGSRGRWGRGPAAMMPLACGPTGS
jgi:hypothetical protein